MIGSMAKAVHKTLNALEPLESAAERVVSGVGKKALDAGVGAAKMAKTASGAILTKENTSWSRKLLPKTANAWGVAGITGVASTGIVLNEGLKSRNTNKLGRISYMDGPARMTGPQTTGALNAAQNVNNGQMYDEIMSQAMQSSSNLIDDYGATGDLVFALHNAR